VSVFGWEDQRIRIVCDAAPALAANSRRNRLLRNFISDFSPPANAGVTPEPYFPRHSETGR
jgi:hypothetical protein